MQVILYSGKDCCLCEKAESLLNNIDDTGNLQIDKVDVRSTTDLYHAYGARIPVLYRKDTQQELAWPFDMFQLEEFMF
jgi:hypothetical protein